MKTMSLSEVKAKLSSLVDSVEDRDGEREARAETRLQASSPITKS